MLPRKHAIEFFFHDVMTVIVVVDVDDGDVDDDITGFENVRFF